MAADFGDRQLEESLMAFSDGIRAAAVFSSRGEQIAASDGRDWSREAAAVWAAAEAGGPAIQVHVGSEDGEVFALRADGGSVVATGERFALASLVFSDLRALLRDLGTARGGA